MIIISLKIAISTESNRLHSIPAKVPLAIDLDANQCTLEYK